MLPKVFHRENYGVRMLGFVQMHCFTILLPKGLKWCREVEPDLVPRLAVPGRDQDQDQ